MPGGGRRTAAVEGWKKRSAPGRIRGPATNDAAARPTGVAGAVARQGPASPAARLAGRGRGRLDGSGCRIVPSARGGVGELSAESDHDRVVTRQDDALRRYVISVVCATVNAGRPRRLLQCGREAREEKAERAEWTRGRRADGTKTMRPEQDERPDHPQRPRSQAPSTKITSGDERPSGAVAATRRTPRAHVR